MAPDTMRILLPPSEGKTTPADGLPLAFDVLSHPELTDARRALAAALSRLCADDPVAARAALGLGDGQDAEIARNRSLESAPTAPAWRVYTGVLYAALDAGGLDDDARAFLARRVWVASALFGLVGLGDPIPAYRLSGDARLPGIGALPAFWKPRLTPILAAETGLVVDLRSGTYVKLAPLPASVAPRAVAPRVLQKMPSGPPKVVTHFNKATKGRLVRALARSGALPQTPEDFAQAVARWGPDVALTPPAAPGTPWGMDIVVDTL